jgi:hypothetical protein
MNFSVQDEIGRGSFDPTRSVGFRNSAPVSTRGASYSGLQEKSNPPRQLIFIVERGFTIPAALTELAGNTSSDPADLHDVHLAATGTDALDLRFPATRCLGKFAKPMVGIF